MKKQGLEHMEDPPFLVKLKNNLRDSLFNLIVDEVSRPAVEAFSLLRVPVPQEMVVSLSSETSFRAAAAQGLVVIEKNRAGEDHYRCIGALAFRITGEEGFTVDDSGGEDFPKEELSRFYELHKKVAKQFETIYREEWDPVWLREAYYHRFVIGDPRELDRFGKVFRTEIFQAGEYWYGNERAYPKALWAYRTLKGFGYNAYRVNMRYASCLIRCDEREEGEKLFKKLLAEYPNLLSLKNAYVDSLIYVRDFAQALNELENFELSVFTDQYTAGQFGRSYLGCHRNNEAANAFHEQLRQRPQPFVYRLLARAYHRMGQTSSEQKLLMRGLKEFPESRSLQLAHASLLERQGETKEALSILRKLHEDWPLSCWVMFPLVKTLKREGCLEEALELWKKVRDLAQPEFMRRNIEVELAMGQGRYETAVRWLDNISDDDESAVGLKKEVFLAWANSVDDAAEKARIAELGLVVPISKTLETNVPLLVSSAKLCMVAADCKKCKHIVGLIESIAGRVPELITAQLYSVCYSLPECPLRSDAAVS